jgi:glycosyltransferase involved in cell wall biosynthesis
MRRPALDELPSPPQGKSGWPWTEGVPQLPETMHNGSAWPRVSVVTPSYNQGKFIEETIRSVLLQGYPNLEYIIIDGASTDESLGIIKQYEPWLAYWVSQPDQGQSHAINKGFRKASGEIIAYLNSDDMYLTETIGKAVEFLFQNKDVDLVYGDCQVVDEESNIIYVGRSREFDLFVELCCNFVQQPTVFMRRRLLKLVGYFDEELHYAMDLDYWFRAAMKAKFSYFPVELAKFRITDASKTGKGLIPFVREREKILDRFFRLYADDNMRKWRKRVFAWNYYRIGSRLYEDNEREMARRAFVKGIRLEPFSLRTIASLLMLFDINANTKFFPKIATFMNIRLHPSQKSVFLRNINSLVNSDGAEE